MLEDALADAPVVALLGPHRTGKTALALQLTDAADRPAALYLDLESPADRARLAEPALALGAHAQRRVIIDGIERMPALLPVIGALLDRGDGRSTGRFLLIGATSPVRLLAAGHALAGRLRVVERLPLGAAERAPSEQDMLWLRGGFPGSLLASTDTASLCWRYALIRDYLDRHLRLRGPRIAADLPHRFWTLLAHRQASVLNQAEVARALGVDGKTVAAWLDQMSDLLLVRRLPPWQGPSAKRLVRAPKVYIRDSGLVHALLGIETQDALLGHPVAGNSWEGMVVESLLAAAPEGTQACFYRTAVGAEIDLVLTIPGRGVWAIDITRRLIPKPERGFHHGCDDVQPDAGFVVYPGTARHRMAGGVEAISLHALCERLTGRAPAG